MATLKARLIKAKRVLQTYRQNHSLYKNNPVEPDEQAMTDMMADCLHLAHVNNWNVENLLFRINDHFQAEKHQHKKEPA